MTYHNGNEESVQPAKSGLFLGRIALPPLQAHLLFWPIVVVGAGLDLWSKYAVFNWLSTEPGAEFSIINGFFKFVMRENSGAAFSIARDQTTMLVTVSIVALVAVVGIFLFGRIHRKLMQTGLALFTAGIIGNLYDRLFNDGYVRDFIDVYYGLHHWPAFNVADSMLCIAVGLLIITNITSEPSEKPAHPHK
jgi:signal peptidase II